MLSPLFNSKSKSMLRLCGLVRVYDSYSASRHCQIERTKVGEEDPTAWPLTHLGGGQIGAMDSRGETVDDGNWITKCQAALAEVSESKDWICTRLCMPVLSAHSDDSWLDSAMRDWMVDFHSSGTSAKSKKKSIP